MKTLFFSFILFCFSLVSMVSCISRKPPEPVRTETTKTITQTVKDTVYKVEADSAFYYAWIDCRNGKPIIINSQTEINDYNERNPRANATAPQSKPGKNTAVNASLKNGKLNVDCHQEALNLFKSWKETYIKENHASTTLSAPQYIEKPFRWYHKALMWTGGICLLLIGFGLSLKFIKPF